MKRLKSTTPLLEIAEELSYATERIQLLDRRHRHMTEAWDSQEAIDGAYFLLDQARRRRSRLRQLAGDKLIEVYEPFFTKNLPPIETEAEEIEQGEKSA